MTNIFLVSRYSPFWFSYGLGYCGMSCSLIVNVLCVFLEANNVASGRIDMVLPYRVLGAEGGRA